VTENKEKWNFKSIIGLAVVSLLICGLLFPLLITGMAQVFLPYQANGEIVQLKGKPLGQTSPKFLLARFLPFAK
jgi:K+-transporting ATPase c subunit